MKSPIIIEKVAVSAAKDKTGYDYELLYFARHQFILYNPKNRTVASFVSVPLEGVPFVCF